MNFFDQWHEGYIENGWPVVPVYHKVPSVWAGDHYRPMKDWARFGDRHPNEKEIEIAGQGPDTGIGIPCGGQIGRILGFDIDILDIDVAFQVRREVEKVLGETPLIRVGKAPKVLLVYRWADGEDMTGFKHKPIEILGTGQQFQSHGEHPDGYQYQWIGDGTPSDVDASDLPAVTRSDVVALVDRIWDVLPDHLKPKQQVTLSGGEVSVASEGTQASPKAVFEALRAIPNVDWERAQVVRVGMALKAALPPEYWGEGRRAYSWWRNLSPKCGMSGRTDSAERDWDSFQPRGNIGAGTLFGIAFQCGWAPGPELQFHESQAEINFEMLMRKGMSKG